MRRALVPWSVALAGCSLIVPGPGDFTYDRDADGGAPGTDAGDRDAGDIDAGPRPDAGPDAAGVDAGCTGGELFCDGACVDAQTSTDHCGRCGNACDDGWVCRLGECFDPAVRISASPSHTCAVRGSGRVFCWGANFSGQLGDGGPFDSSTPVEVVGIVDAIDVSCGGESFGDPDGMTCAHRRTGEVACWGVDNGVFGDGTARREPETTSLSAAQYVDTSYGVGCTLTAARRPYCWGRFLMAGALEAPHEVVALGFSGPWATAIDTSSGHACAIATDNRIFCAGQNTVGQLGWASATVAETDMLRPVPDITDAVEVSTSLAGTCFRRMDGTVACFGGEAALASGGTTTTEHPSPEDVPGLTDVMALESASFGVGTCAIHGAERSVSCWGADFPAFGTGTSPGLGAAIYSLDGADGVTDIAVGLGHVCVVIDGRVQCLGSGLYGQLGDGRTEASSTFVDVVLP